jgi:hypothetical protein
MRQKADINIMWAFGHICPAWPMADAERYVK